MTKTLALIAFLAFLAAPMLAQSTKAKPVQVLFPVATTDALLLIHPDGTTQALTLNAAQFCITADFVLTLCAPPAVATAPPMSVKQLLQPAADGSYTFTVNAANGQPPYDPAQWITLHRNGMEQTAGADYTISTAQASPASVSVTIRPNGAWNASDTVSARWIR